MQNRPKKAHPASQIFYQEIPLPPEFPVYGFPYTQGYRDWSWLHFHNGVEIGCCLEGEGLFFIENQILPFFAGDISLIFDGQPHIARSGPNASSQWYFITVDFRQLFCGGELVREPGLSQLLFGGKEGGSSFPGILSAAGHPQLRPVLLAVIQELSEKKGRYQERVKALLWTFLLHLLDLAEENAFKPAAQPSKASDGGLNILAPALHRITNRYYEAFSIQELAADCNLSETHFRRLFHQAMGCSPLQYLNQVRLRMAGAMLRSTRLAVSQVAGEVGFSSLSSFNRMFQQSYGASPRAWRNRQLKSLGSEDNLDQIR